MTFVLASFAQPCILCGAKADHTIAACDARASRRPVAAYEAATSTEAADNLVASINAAETEPCGRCAGTGQHISHMLNNVPVPSGLGECFRCAGKGRQTAADKARNAAYDEYSAYKAVAADMAEATVQAVHPGTSCEFCGATSDHLKNDCDAAMKDATTSQCFGRSCGECGPCMDGYQPDYA